MLCYVMLQETIFCTRSEGRFHVFMTERKDRRYLTLWIVTQFRSENLYCTIATISSDFYLTLQGKLLIP